MTRTNARQSEFSRRVSTLREAVAAQLWPVPVASVVVAVIAGILIPLLDAEIDENLSAQAKSLLFGGGSDAARAVLSAIAGSLITATSLTFSLTVVSLQLASSQASPRLLRLFSSDRAVHATLAVFLGTFAFALTVLRTVEDAIDSTEPFVPRIAVTVASVLTLVSVVTLTLFLAHLARQLRVETMMRDVHDETNRAIALHVRSEHDATSVEPDARPLRTNVVLAEKSGFITSVNRRRLVQIGQEHDIVLAEEHAVGTSLVAGVPVVSWWHSSSTDPARVDRDRLARSVNDAVTVGFERTASQDIDFGVRQLADIASRALSPGTNDPTTAVHAMSHLSALLCAVAAIPVEPAGLADSEGRVRVIRRTPNFESLIAVAIDQPRHYGSADSDVVRRLFELLREVAYQVRTEAHRDVVRSQTARLIASVDAGDFDDIHRRSFSAQAETIEPALRGEWN